MSGKALIQSICDRQFDTTVHEPLAVDLWAKCSEHLRAVGLSSSSKEAIRTTYEKLDEMVRTDVLTAFIASFMDSTIPEGGVGPGTNLYARVRARLGNSGAHLKPAKTPPIDRSRSLGL